LHISELGGVAHMDWISGVLDGAIKRSGISSMGVRKYRIQWKLLLLCFVLFPLFHGSGR
jgi:hypothetical protein